MRILFNCSTNLQGGAAQNAANFVIKSIDENQLGIDNIEYYYILSSPVKKIIDDYGYIILNYSLIKKSPSRDFSSRKTIKLIEGKVNPDIVFTMAGPAYVKFSGIHIMGCSNPYIIFANLSDILFGRSKIQALYRYLQTIYQKYHIKNADYFLFQSESSKKYFMEAMGKNKDNAFVVPNAMGLAGLSSQDHDSTNIYSEYDCMILCPFENYPHKGLHLIPKISEQMVKKYNNFKFVVTVPSESEVNFDSRYSSYSQFISFIGKQPYKQMANLYSNADVVFLPSILEIFSSVCIEALFFKKPLVVADREFNREILGEYAFYCNPSSTESCVSAINFAYEVRDDYDYLNNAKDFICSKYGLYKDRYSAIKKILMKISNDQF